MTELSDFQLVVGETVRWRRRPNQRWKPGKITRIERDGSIGLVDGKGSARALRPHLIEHQVRGKRGALNWEPLVPEPNGTNPT